MCLVYQFNNKSYITSYLYLFTDLDFLVNLKERITCKMQKNVPTHSLCDFLKMFSKVNEMKQVNSFFFK